jgi:hypothetical protein
MNKKNIVIDASVAAGMLVATLTLGAILVYKVAPPNPTVKITSAALIALTWGLSSLKVAEFFKEMGVKQTRSLLIWSVIAFAAGMLAPAGIIIKRPVTNVGEMILWLLVGAVIGAFGINHLTGWPLITLLIIWIVSDILVWIPLKFYKGFRVIFFVTAGVPGPLTFAALFLHLIIQIGVAGRTA